MPLKRRHLKPSIGIRPPIEFFMDVVESHPDLVAMEIKKEGGWKRWTEAELLKHVKAVSLKLRSLAVGKGDRVGIVGENSPEWVVAFLGIFYTGAVAVPLDARLTREEIEHFLNIAETSVVFASSSVEINRDNIPSLRDIIPLESVMEFEGDAMLPSISLDDELLILFTSGTTGNSKGVVLTNRNVGSNIDSFLQVLEIYPGDRIFCMLPFHHIFPITTNILAGITVGATMTLARSLKPNELREDLRDSEPQIMTVVPLILEKMVKRIQKEIEKLPALKRGFVKSLKLAPAGIRKRIFSKVREEMGMGKLRYLVSGGAALPEFVSSFLEFMGFPVLQGYGLSETSPVVSVNPPEAPRNKSVGLPLPGVEVKIVDPDKDGIGEIAVRGDLVMKGYYKNPEETKKVITEDGWFLTGDMGRFDKDGYLYITGRKKSVIVTMGGKNIYPEEIEEKLLESPFILETLVISREGQLVAVIHPNFDEIRNEIPGMNEERIKELLRKEVRKINEHLADYKRIRRIMVVEEELPKTTTQKVKRYIITPESIPFERTIKVEE